jgi:hypothetical protein
MMKQDILSPSIKWTQPRCYGHLMEYDRHLQEYGQRYEIQVKLICSRIINHVKASGKSCLALLWNYGRVPSIIANRNINTCSS